MWNWRWANTQYWKTAKVLCGHEIVNMNNEVSERVRKLIAAMSSGLVEREEHIKLMLLAALAGEHVLLIGPPGTAKSLLARRLRLAFRNATFFERLLTQFSIPEDLFGPYSLEDLDKGRYRRITEGYLADADVGFLDEIFKSNPSILNALLTILNERVFHNVPPIDENGDCSSNAPQPLPVPLKCLIGASNEVPEPGELDALVDRFLIRSEVGPVDDFQKLLKSGSEDETAIEKDLAFTAEELENIRNSAKRVIVPPQVDELLELLRYRMAELQLDVSDRRWLKIRKLLQVAAYTSGRDQVSPLDALLVPHCVWLPQQDQRKSEPTEPDKETTGKSGAGESSAQVRDDLTTWLQQRLWDPMPTQPGMLDRQITTWEKELQKIAELPLEKRDAKGIRNQFKAVKQLLETTSAAHRFLTDEADRFDTKKLRDIVEKTAPQSEGCIAHCEWAEHWLAPKTTGMALEQLEDAACLAEEWLERIEAIRETYDQLHNDTKAAIAVPEPGQASKKIAHTATAGTMPDPYDFGHSPEDAMSVAPKFQQDWVDYLSAHPAVKSTSREVVHTFQKNKHATPWTIDFKLIPPGEFINNKGESVVIEKPFLFGKYPITQKQWQLAAVGPNPWGSDHSGDSLPACSLSQTDAIAFCKRLNEIQGLESGYRPPTSDEWEYACRAGTATNYWYGDAFNSAKSIAFKYSTTIRREQFSGLRLLKVDDARNAPNPFGLCGMHGNVFERCISSDESGTACGGCLHTSVSMYPGRLYSSFRMQVSKEQSSFSEPLWSTGEGSDSDALGLRIVRAFEF